MRTDLSDFSGDQPVGEQLRRARLDQNHTIEEAAAHTRISLSTLRAIEEQAFDRLPADGFTKGLVSLYASYLGLEGEPLAMQFIRERRNGSSDSLTPLQKSQIDHSLEPKKLAEQARVSSAATATALLFGIVVSFSGFCLYYGWNPFAYLTDKALSLTTTVKNTFHPADPATSSMRTQNTLSLQAVFYADCRVQVAIDNQPTSDQTYLKGSTIQWEAERTLQLDFFQEHCADLQFNGSLLAAPVYRDGRATLRLPLTVHGP
ncbi:MAG: helix-turn-helix domain-containing protein [Desulfobulbus sp.]|nr:helix-turn-helix domain-containing protein [Desulfobulbus sp.]